MLLSFFRNQDGLNQGRRTAAAILLLFMALGVPSSSYAEEKKKESCTRTKSGEGDEYAPLNGAKKGCEFFVDALNSQKEEVVQIKGGLSKAGSQFNSFSGAATDNKAAIDASKAMMEKSVIELEGGKKRLQTVLGTVGKIQEKSKDGLKTLTEAEAKLNTRRKELQDRINANVPKLNDLETRINRIRQNSAANPQNAQISQANLNLLEPQHKELKRITDELKEKHEKVSKALKDYPGGREDMGAVVKGSEKLGSDIKAEQGKLDSSISGLKEKIATLEKAKLGEAGEEKTADQKKADESKSPEQRKAEADNKAMEGMSGAPSMDPVKTKVAEDMAKKQASSGDGDAASPRASTGTGEDSLAEAAGESKESAAIKKGMSDGKKQGAYVEGNEALPGTQMTQEQMAGTQSTKDALTKDFEKRNGASGVSAELREKYGNIQEIDRKLEAYGSFEKEKTPKEVSDLLAERKKVVDDIYSKPALANEAQQLKIGQRTLTNTQDDPRSIDVTVQTHDALGNPTGITNEATRQMFVADPASDKIAKRIAAPEYAESVSQHYEQTLNTMDKEIIASSKKDESYRRNYAAAPMTAELENAQQAYDANGMYTGGMGTTTAKDKQLQALSHAVEGQEYGAGVAGARQNTDEKKGEMAGAIKAATAREKGVDNLMLGASVIPGASVVDYMRADSSLQGATGNMHASGFDQGTVERVQEAREAKDDARNGVIIDAVSGGALGVAGKGAKVAWKGVDKLVGGADNLANAGVDLGSAAVRSAPAQELSRIPAQAVPTQSPRTITSTLGASDEIGSYGGRQMSMPSELSTSGQAKGSFAPTQEARWMNSTADAPVIDAPLSASRLVDDTPAPAKAIAPPPEAPRIEAPRPVATVETAEQVKTISPPPAVRTADNFEPVQNARMGLDNAPRGTTAFREADEAANVVPLRRNTPAAPTTVENRVGRTGSEVGRTIDNADDNVVDLASRRKPANETPKRGAADNDNFNPNRQAARQAANGGWVDNAVSDGAEFTGGMAKTFAPLAQTMSADAQAATRAAAANVGSAAPAISQPAIRSSGIARSAPVPTGPSGGGFGGGPASISGNAAANLSPTWSATAKAGRAAEASRNAAVASLKKDGMSEAAAKAILEQPTPALARAQVFNDPSLAKLSRSQKTELAEHANDFRQQYQAARSAAVPETPTIAAPASAGRSIASASDEAGEAGAAASRKAGAAPAASKADDYAYEAYGSAPKRSDGGFSDYGRSARSAASDSADEVASVGRVAEKEAAQQTAKAADDAAESTLAKAGKNADEKNAVAASKTEAKGAADVVATKAASYIEPPTKKWPSGQKTFLSQESRGEVESWLSRAAPGKVDELKKKHLLHDRFDDKLPLSSERAVIYNSVVAEGDINKGIATSAKANRISAYEKALLEETRKVEAKVAKEGMPSPPGLKDAGSGKSQFAKPRDNMLGPNDIDDIVPGLENPKTPALTQKAMRERNEIPDYLTDVSRSDKQTIQVVIDNKVADDYAKSLGRRGKFDDDELAKLQREARNREMPKIDNFQKELLAREQGRELPRGGSMESQVRDVPGAKVADAPAAAKPRDNMLGKNDIDDIVPGLENPRTPGLTRQAMRERHGIPDYLTDVSRSDKQTIQSVIDNKVADDYAKSLGRRGKFDDDDLAKLQREARNREMPKIDKYQKELMAREKDLAANGPARGPLSTPDAAATKVADEGGQAAPAASKSASAASKTADAAPAAKPRDSMLGKNDIDDVAPGLENPRTPSMTQQAMRERHGIPRYLTDVSRSDRQTIQSVIDTKVADDYAKSLGRRGKFDDNDLAKLQREARNREMPKIEKFQKELLAKEKDLATNAPMAKVAKEAGEDAGAASKLAKETGEKPGAAASKTADAAPAKPRDNMLGKNDIDDVVAGLENPRTPGLTQKAMRERQGIPSYLTDVSRSDKQTIQAVIDNKVADDYAKSLGRRGKFDDDELAKLQREARNREMPKIDRFQKELLAKEKDLAANPPSRSLASVPESSGVKLAEESGEGAAAAAAKASDASPVASAASKTTDAAPAAKPRDSMLGKNDIDDVVSGLENPRTPSLTQQAMRERQGIPSYLTDVSRSDKQTIQSVIDNKVADDYAKSLGRRGKFDDNDLAKLQREARNREMPKIDRFQQELMAREKDLAAKAPARAPDASTAKVAKDASEAAPAASKPATAASKSADEVPAGKPRDNMLGKNDIDDVVAGLENPRTPSLTQQAMRERNGIPDYLTDVSRSDKQTIQSVIDTKVADDYAKSLGRKGKFDDGDLAKLQREARNREMPKIEKFQQELLAKEKDLAARAPSAPKVADSVVSKETGAAAQAAKKADDVPSAPKNNPSSASRTAEKPRDNMLGKNDIDDIVPGLENPRTPSLTRQAMRERHGIPDYLTDVSRSDAETIRSVIDAKVADNYGKSLGRKGKFDDGDLEKLQRAARNEEMPKIYKYQAELMEKEKSLAAKAPAGQLAETTTAKASAAQAGEAATSKGAAKATPQASRMPEGSPKTFRGLDFIDDSVPGLENVKMSGHGQRALREKHGIPDYLTDVSKSDAATVRAMIDYKASDDYVKSLGRKGKFYDDDLEKLQREARNREMPKIQAFQEELIAAEQKAPGRGLASVGEEAENIAAKNVDEGAKAATKEADERIAKAAAKEGEEASSPAIRAAAADEAKAEGLLAKGAKDAEPAAPLKDPLDDVLAHEKNALDNPKASGPAAKAPSEEKVKEALDRVSLKGEVRKGDAELAERFIAARKLDEMDPDMPFWKRQDADRLRKAVDNSADDVEDVSRRLAADMNNPALKSELLVKSEKYVKDQQRLMESLGLTNNRPRFVDAEKYGDKVIPARWVLESTGSKGVTANKALAGALKNSNGRIGLRIDPVANRFYGSAAHFDPKNGFLVFDKVASKTARIEPNSTILHEIGHAVRWDKDQMFKAALKNPNATPEELAKLRKASTYRAYSNADSGRSMKTTEGIYNTGYSMDEMRVAAQDTIRNRRLSREKDFIERVKGPGALTDEYRTFNHSDVQRYEKRAYAMASDVEQHLKTLGRKAEGAQIVRDPSGQFRLKFTDGTEHFAEYAGGQYRVMVPYYQNGERTGSWIMELSNVGKGTDRSIAGSMKREIDQGLREAQGVKRALEQSSGLEPEKLARNVDRILAGQGEIRSGRILGEAVDRAADEAFFKGMPKIRPQAAEGAELGKDAIRAAPKGGDAASDVMKATGKGADATGASKKPGLVERLFGKPDVSKPPRADQKAFATWLKDAYTPKELDKWNFVKQGQINRARDGIEKRQNALNDLIDKSSGRSLSKAEEATILEESRKLANDQKALLDKIGRPHNQVMKAPAGEWGGQWVPERYVLKSVRPTAEEIAKDPKWAKLGSSGNKSINTFVKNMDGKADVIIDPVLIRSTGTAGMWDPSNKALIFRKIESTTPKIESNLVYMHEIRHAKRSVDQAALEGKLARFSRAESELVGLTDNELMAMAQKQGKKYDLDKHEIEENFSSLKNRRDDAERFAGEEIDDLERKLAKDQLNGRFRANDGKTISDFDGYERFMSLDETTTYAREVTQASRMAEHRQFIEYALGKQAVPEDLAKRSNLTILRDSVEGTDAAQRAARENLGLAKKSVEKAEAVGTDGSTRVFETPTGAELRIRNTGGMLEAEIPLVKHGDNIGTYTVKVPAPDARRLTDAEMLERVGQGIAKQQDEVRGTVKSAQGGIKAIEEVAKTDAALAARRAEVPLASAKPSVMEKIKNTASSIFTKKEADTVAEVSKDGWMKRYLTGNKISEEGKAKARELAELYRTKEITPNRPAALQKEIDQHRKNVAKLERQLLADYTGSRIAPNNAKAQARILDSSKKLANEQLELMKKIGRPDNEVVFVKGHTEGDQVFPDRHALRSKNPYADAEDAKAADKIYKATDRGVSANKALDGFIYKHQDAAVLIDPLYLQGRQAGGVWNGATKEVVLPAVESKSAKISTRNSATNHEMDHGARDLAQTKRMEDARKASLERPPAPYFANYTDDMVRDNLNWEFKGKLSADEIEGMAQKQIKERDEWRAFRDDLDNATANPTAADFERGRTNFEGYFVADEGKSLKNGMGYNESQSLDEIHTFGRDIAQNESVKEQANFIRKALGVQAVPPEMLRAIEPGSVASFNKMADSTRARLQGMRDGLDSFEVVRDGRKGSPVSFKTPQGDDVNITKTPNGVRAEIPVYRDNKKVGTFVMERAKENADGFTADEMRNFLRSELDANIKELDATKAKVAERVNRNNPLVERYREGSEIAAQKADNSTRRAEGALARDADGKVLEAELLPAEKPSAVVGRSSGAPALERPTIDGELVSAKIGNDGPAALPALKAEPAVKDARALVVKANGAQLAPTKQGWSTPQVTGAAKASWSAPQVGSAGKAPWAAPQAVSSASKSWNAPVVKQAGNVAWQAPVVTAGPGNKAELGSGTKMLLGASAAGSLVGGAALIDKAVNGAGPSAIDHPTMISGMNPTHEEIEAKTGASIPGSWTKPGNVRQAADSAPKSATFGFDTPGAGSGKFTDRKPANDPNASGLGGKGSGPAGAATGNPTGGEKQETPGGQKLRDMEKGGERRDGNTNESNTNPNTGTDNTVRTGGTNTPKGDSSMSMTDKLMIGGAVLAAGGAAAYMLTKKKSNKGANLELQAALLAQKQKEEAAAASAGATATATETSTETSTSTATGSSSATATSTASDTASGTGSSTSTGSGTSTATSTSTGSSTSTGTNTSTAAAATIRATNTPPGTFVGATLAPIFVQLYNKDGSKASASGVPVKISCAAPADCSLRSAPTVVNTTNGKASFERVSFTSAHAAAVLKFEADGMPSATTPPIAVSVFQGMSDMPAGQVRRATPRSRQ